MPRKERIKLKKKTRNSYAAKGSIPLTSWLKRENKDAESCSSDKESIEEIQGKAFETRENDEGEVRTNEEESEMSEEVQGDIRPNEEEEEMKREVQGEINQEKDREITEEGAAEADIEGQMTQEKDREITEEGAANAPEVYPSLMALQFPTDPSLRSLCNEERISDLLLLSIERDIPINREEVVQIFKNSTERRVLL
ncbi:gelsolin-related protein of 125 kDa-like [Pseudorasbora parva]|uniref:gelsolin-related protein of 125 kDa-like n=1 Tax=Pseudorasbora parva TaxID=51549 RepID=UPI00351EB20D